LAFGLEPLQEEAKAVEAELEELSVKPTEEKKVSEIADTAAAPEAPAVEAVSQKEEESKIKAE
jgi:hypothetical protein